MTQTSTDTDSQRRRRLWREPSGQRRLWSGSGAPAAGGVDGALPAGRISAETVHVLPILVPVIAAGAAAVVAAVWTFVASQPGGATLAGAATFLVAATIAEAVPVPLEGVAAGRTSLATVFIVGAAVEYGWAVATIVAGLSMAFVEAARRRQLSRVTYNASVYALAGIAAGAGAGALTGTSLAHLTIRTVLASFAFYLVDILLLAAVITRESGERPLALLGAFMYGTLVPFAVLTCLAVILVLLWDRSPVAAIALAGPLASIILYERWMHDALRRLREVDRLKDEFIAVVSHELRTPLASIYAAAATLQRPQLDTSTRDSLLRIVHEESARLARLVNQVLGASRLDSGRVEWTLTATDPVQVAQEVVDAARTHLADGLSIDLESAAAPPAVWADPEKLKQVLVNLVDNAVKYSPDGGAIEVRVERDDGGARFDVHDEGLGIPLEEQARIFEKFHRLDPNVTRGVGGTGLGLYICKQLVEGMGGRIWVDSELGRGSTFAFTLPLDDGASAEASERLASTEGSTTVPPSGGSTTAAH
jgi:signal transduction histidine kinase